MTRTEFVALLIVIPFFPGGWHSSQAVDNSSQELREFDEYSDIKSNDAKARLDNFAIELQNVPHARGYIVAYGGRRCPNVAQAHANLARSYLINTRGLDSERIVTINGGRRSEGNTYTVELWFVPAGAPPPRATPTLAKRCRR